MGCFNSTVIDRPIDEVWSVISDFHDMSWAQGVVESLEVVGETPADRIGARRILNGAFHETLRTRDDAGYTYSYTIDDGPGPVSKDSVQGYVGTVRLLPVTVGGGTFVEWSSRWETSAGGVAEFCDPIYKALLDALKKHMSTSAARRA